MQEDFTKLDVLLQETASCQSEPPPDLRPEVFAEITRRRRASLWRRFLNWLDFTEPFYAPRPAAAVFALAMALVLGMAIPIQMSANQDDGQRAVHALKLDVFAAPKLTWTASR